MIRKLYKIFVFGFIKLISLLPLKVLYILAAIITPVISSVISYRKETIKENLNNAFPDWDEKQIKKTMKAFYSYFAVMMVESIKVLSMNLASMEKHIKFQNPEIIKQYYKEGKSVIAISAHLGNWEWTHGLRNEIPHHCLIIYKPLSDKHFNNLITRARSKFNSSMVSMREIPRELLRLKREGIISLSGYISDQSPIWDEVQYWTTFMNQNTPVYLGPEKLARKMDTAVVYFRMKIISRGQYEVEIVPITDQASKTKEHEITEKHVKLLEADIRKHPEYWLWTHRRWKLTKRREEQESQGIFRFEGQFRKKEGNA